MDREWHHPEENAPLPEHTFYPEYTPEHPDVAFFKESFVTSREENIFQGEVPPEEANTADALREERRKRRNRESWLRWFLGAAVKAGAVIFAVIMLIINLQGQEDPHVDSRAKFSRLLGVDLLKAPFEPQQDYTFRELKSLWDGDPEGPHQYDFDHLIVLKEATCTENGESAYKCTECGVLLKHATTKDHTPAPARQENIQAPGCETDGSYEDVTVCADCGRELSRVKVTTPANGHTGGDPVIESMVVPTCTAEGSCEETVYCSVCHQELSRNAKILAPTGHTEGTPVLENRIASTCTVNGSYDRVTYCSSCGEEISRVQMPLPLSEHVGKEPVIENSIAPTCTAAGSHDEVVYCAVCGGELSRTPITEAALGHDYKEKVTDATCTEQGYTTHTCSRCNDSFKDTYTKALGHNYKEKVIKPTCTEKGYTAHTCSRCKDSYKDKETKALGHNYKEKVTKPTCTEKGYTVHTCSRCGDSYKDNYVDALGHNFKLGVWDEDTTLTCSRCGTAALTVKYSSQKFVITLNSDFVSQLKRGGYYGWFFVTTSSGAYVTDQESWNESSSKITLTPTFAGFTSGSSVKCRACFMYSEGSDEGMAVSSSITVKVP